MSKETKDGDPIAIVETVVKSVAKTGSLLSQLLTKQKDYVAPKNETFTVNVVDVQQLKDADRVMLRTDKGNFFAFKNVFDGGAPIGSKAFKAELTLTLNGEYVNLTRVKYDLESIGKYSFVATRGLAVQL